MKLNRLLILTLAISLVLHLSLFLWVNIPRIGRAKKASPDGKKILLSFHLPSTPSSPSLATQNPSQPPKTNHSKKRPHPPRKASEKPISKKTSARPAPKKIVRGPTPKKTKRPQSKTRDPQKSSKSPQEVHQEKAPPGPPGPEEAETKTEAQRLSGTSSKEKTHLTNDHPTQVRGAPSPSTGPSRAEIKTSYLAMILARIEKKRYYPRLARMRNYEGRVGLLLEISAEGKLLSVKIVKGSGHRILDRAALKITRMAAPFPPPPPELGPPPLKLKIFLRFHLKNGTVP